MSAPAASRLTGRDLVRVGLAGLRARPLRVVLSALGIAIGIAAMVAVLGISASSRAQLEAVLDRLGTNLLTVSPGQTLFGGEATLPEESVAMIGRIPAVTSATATGAVPGARVYRNDRIPAGHSGGIAVLAAGTDLLGTVGATVRSGAWLNEGIARYPAVVLGAETARLLGIGAAGSEVQVWLGGRWFTVIGILNEVPLAPELDTAALVGWLAAQRLLDFDGHPSTVYTRSADEAVLEVRSVLARTANPQRPEEVSVGRPSDALAAADAAEAAFTGVLLGLGGVALLVGGVGVANTMVISVMERRGEIGLRRALGATRGQIRVQFLTEALLLSLLGGAVGVLLGAGVTAAYALARAWPTTLPLYATLGALAITAGIGTLAGLYPAIRASHLPPTQALATP